jgi:hypothetical protein
MLRSGADYPMALQSAGGHRINSQSDELELSPEESLLEDSPDDVLPASLDELPDFSP